MNELLALESMKNICGEDTKFRDELLQTMLEFAPSQIARLRRAEQAGDYAGIQEAAHTLKGSSRTSGGLVLGNACEALEMLARGGADREALGRATANVQEEWCQLEQAIHQHFGRNMF